MLQGKTPDRKVKVAIVTARFNNEVTYKLEEGALKALKQNGLANDQILQIRVPGAFEIPLAAKYCIDQGYDAVVALGAVIRGETSHYDYVCSAVERGCTNLQTEHAVPVAFGILTTDNDEQAMERAGGRHGNKGEEAALVALEMLDLKDKINKR
jgi:6,7-dimethyl-8-ribityllumazine synthase